MRSNAQRTRGQSEREVPTPVATRSAALARAAGRLEVRGPVLWQTGFRPFFLLAALLAISAIPGLLIALEVAPGAFAPLPLFAWHAHEMLFGFTGAVLAGFLLTATPVWTGRPTAHGLGLALLVVLWGLGRLTAAGVGPSAVAAAVNLSFFPIVSFLVARPIISSRRHRNLAFPFALLGLAWAQATLWAAALGVLPYGAAQRAEWVAIDLIALVIAVIGGRIIPMFTRNRLPGFSPRAPGLIDHAAMGSLIALATAHAAGIHGGHLTAALGVAGALNGARLIGWGTPRALVEAPFVGVLHLGYALLALGLVLEAFHPSVGRHLVTVGGVGLLCLGMMARVSLGHTGRTLEPPRGTGVAFGLLATAAGLRSVWSLVPADGGSQALLIAAAVAWTAAFGLFLVRFGPILLRPRADGAPG